MIKQNKTKRVVFAFLPPDVLQINLDARDEVKLLSEPNIPCTSPTARGEFLLMEY